MIYVGIDIASTKHDFIMLYNDGVFNSRRSTNIPNSIEGYKKLHETITEFCGVSNYFEVRIGLESTGFYHLNLFLHHCVCVVDEHHKPVCDERKHTE